MTDLLFSDTLELSTAIARCSWGPSIPLPSFRDRNRKNSTFSPRYFVKQARDQWPVLPPSISIVEANHRSWGAMWCRLFSAGQSSQNPLASSTCQSTAPMTFLPARSWRSTERMSTEHSYCLGDAHASGVQRIILISSSSAYKAC